MVITEYANVKYHVIYLTEEIIKLFLVVENEDKYLKTLGIAKIYELLYNDKAF